MCKNARTFKVTERWSVDVNSVLPKATPPPHGAQSILLAFDTRAEQVSMQQGAE
jgi:hypothetical protein